MVEIKPYLGTSPPEKEGPKSCCNFNQALIRGGFSRFLGGQGSWGGGGQGGSFWPSRGGGGGAPKRGPSGVPVDLRDLALFHKVGWNGDPPGDFPHFKDLGQI